MKKKPSKEEEWTETEGFAVMSLMLKDFFDKVRQENAKKISELSGEQKAVMKHLMDYTEETMLAHYEAYSHNEDDSANKAYSNWKGYIEERKKEYPELADLITSFAQPFMNHVRKLSLKERNITA